MLAAIDFAPFVVIGLALGGLFAASGVGLVVLYRTTGVINLAYGAIGALGAMVAWELIEGVGTPKVVGYAVCILGAGALSWAYGALLAPLLAQRDAMVKAIGSLAFALILLGIMAWIWGDDPRSLALPTSEWSFRAGDVRFDATQLVAIGLSLAVTAAMSLFLRRSRVGSAMRAMAEDREIAATLGVPVRRIESAAWFGSGLLCGATTLILADTYGLDYAGLTFLIISSLSAALVGRMRSLWVTLIAGLAIGVIQSCLTPVESLSKYSAMTPFVVAIIALLWLGRNRSATRSEALRLPPVAARATGRPARSRSVAVGVLAVLATAVLVPALLTDYWVEIGTAVVIYSVVALGAGLLLGRVGLVSLCQVALLGVGGWTALRLGYATSLPFPVVLVLAGTVTALIGVLLSWPALRLGSLYFALITLMVAGAVTVLLTQFNFPNGGGGFLGYDASASATTPLRNPVIAETTNGLFRYATVVAGLMFALAVWAIRGRAGRAWAAIRQDEAAAAAAGIPVTAYKLWGFALASFMTGAVGGLMAATGGGLTSYQFPTQDSLILLAVVMIGGIYSVWGAVLAGMLAKLLPALFSGWGFNPDFVLVLFGIGVVATLVHGPSGMAGQLSDLGRTLRRRVGGSRMLSSAPAREGNA
ncbi:High-affinity branched-chain amino acid transport system permease protein LivH (TC 3.A.1.4.1) [Patulibacter medicamentivorans]|uniref:High-affinity branched-chain amino acid transport system permease protein LivH (TC 3.A.1.4.1) n=1 Tax=Patulibacter medicamentivorans TaxID=1097667 RepID=H0E665_9ACTN|nr:ABC transporter permease [Patulibacter medicamentivorans]EHN10834.1 High-affinity branched-chain amino acid transport system permease protein LivH (TC 3.A.1.4.1) [Patulibacter medicamentivorans]